MTRKQTTLAVLCPTWGAGRGPVPRPLLALARAYRGGDGEGVAQGRPVDMPEFRAPLVTAAVEQVRRLSASASALTADRRRGRA